MTTLPPHHQDGNPSSSQKFLPFEEARAFVHALDLRSRDEWRSYCKSGDRPVNIPSDPGRVYSLQFQGFGDWLGTGRVASQNREYLPFEEARTFAWSLGLRNYNEWCIYRKSGEKPAKIPADPGRVYGTQFQGYVDWLGTSDSHLQKFLPFEEARAYVRTLGLKNKQEWYTYYKSDSRPSNIPAGPWTYYKQEWKGMGDWLGTNAIAKSDREFLPFEEAREYVRGLKLKGMHEWRAYCKSEQRPPNIPVAPDVVYGSQFQGLGDWLDTGRLATHDPRYIRVSREHTQERRRVVSNRYAARKKGALGTYTPEQIQEQLKRQKCRCYYAACGFAKFKKHKGRYVYHIEHTFPLSRVFGTDIPANSIDYLVLACPSCNISKHDKFPWEWPQGGRLF